MKTQNSRWFALASLVLGMGLSSSAHAVWTFDYSAAANNTLGLQVASGAVVTPTNQSATIPLVSGDPKVSLSGVYAVNTGGVIGGNWLSGSLLSYGTNGLGMGSDGTSTPNHALDNAGNTEAVLLSFGSSVVLSSIGLGYTSDGLCSRVGFADVAQVNGVCPTNYTLKTGGAVDLSVFRWVGSGNPPSLAGTSAPAHTGWELVGNYGDMVVDKTPSDPAYNVINTGTVGGTGLAGAGGKGSSWWLISAYNSGFATSSGAENRSTLDNGNDYFKLYAVAGTQCTSTVAGVCGPKKVPEPSSLALVSLGLVGFGYSRRRFRKS